MNRRKDHWEEVYRSKAASQVSWYQPHHSMSLKLIDEIGLAPDAAVIDVGGGASTLVEDLLDRGLCNLTVLDLSAAALATARERLGDRAAPVRWIEADVTQAELPHHAYDLWHDRAVFHFLTEAAAREGYKTALRRALKPGGHLLIATFSLAGPPKCSGLEVMRYSAETLQAELGADFELLRRLDEEHHTPAGAVQNFVYCLFRRRGSPSVN